MIRGLILLSSLAALHAVPAVPLESWKELGEEFDETLLTGPALDDDLINAVNSDSSSTWKAGRNSIFEGATLRDVKTRMGTLKNPDPTTYLPYKAQEKLVELPEQFDWRTDPRASKCPSVSEIRDQSNCGSCWAFGSVEAMTDRICIASNGTKQAHLSAEDVTSCDHLGDMGCSGGIPSTVYTYYHLFGIVTGGNYGDKSMCWSYQMAPCAHHSTSPKYQNCSDPTNAPLCARKCVDNGASWAGSKVKGQAGYSVCQQGPGANCADAMAQEIYQNGPITGMFFVKKSFLSYKSGVYEGKGLLDPMLGGHAIKIMGFGTEGGVPYWLVANSWNSDWGDKGYFKIRRGKNLDMIESAVINGGPVGGMPPRMDSAETTIQI